MIITHFICEHSWVKFDYNATDKISQRSWNKQKQHKYNSYEKWLVFYIGEF